MHARDRDRVHDTRVAQRDIEIFPVELLLFAEHQRLGKGGDVRRKHGVGARNERVRQLLRKQDPPSAPDARPFRRCAQVS